MSGDPRIDELLDRWEDAQEQGQALSPEELCRDCPELLDELRRQLHELQWVAKVLDTRAASQVANAVPFDVPKSLGRYRLDELIGQGGFGQVWKGYDPELDRQVAIKILRPERRGSVFQNTDFLGEAKKVAKLKHPNIVSVHDVGQDQGYCYMVTDLVAGSDLSKVSSNRGLGINESLRIVAKVATALHHAHENGVIHRDIKPHNILLDKLREPFVTDFGIAVTEAEIESDAIHRVGTPAYMAPEQAEPNGPPIDRRCDIYSLGVVLYELLVGIAPYEGHTVAALRIAFRRNRPQQPKSLVPGIPDKLDAVCMKALQLDPGQRWNTAQEFADALIEIMAPAPPIPPVPSGPKVRPYAASKPVASKAWRARRSDTSPWIYAGLAAIAVLAGVFAATRYGKTQKPPAPPATSEPRGPVAMPSGPRPTAGRRVPLRGRTGPEEQDTTLTPGEPPAAAATEVPGRVEPATELSPAPESEEVESKPSRDEKTSTNTHLDIPASDRPPHTARASEPRLDEGPISRRGITNSLGMRFVLIHPGEFLMGTPPTESQRQWDELQHPVRITKPYFMGVYEVTQQQYEQVMGTNPSHFRGDILPVESVSWQNATEFCGKLSGLPEEVASGRSYRLPTEAEWEYACRAGTTGRFAGANLDELAWFADNSGNVRIDSYSIFHAVGRDESRYQERIAANGCRPHPVGSKKPNPWGLYDMHGNVWEHCSDWYEQSYYDASPREDPTGPKKGVYHVNRGGSFGNNPDVCRSGRRSQSKAVPSHMSWGFRIVLSP